MQFKHPNVGQSSKCPHRGPSLTLQLPPHLAPRAPWTHYLLSVVEKPGHPSAHPGPELESGLSDSQEGAPPQHGRCGSAGVGVPTSSKCRALWRHRLSHGAPRRSSRSVGRSAGDLPLSMAVPVEAGLTGFRCRLLGRGLVFTLISEGDPLRFAPIPVKTEKDAGCRMGHVCAEAPSSPPLVHSCCR